MRTRKVWGMVALGLVMGIVVLAQGFKVYPGAKQYTPPETSESREQAKRAPDLHATIYLTDDSFDKVAAFYRGISKELDLPGMAKNPKVPTKDDIALAFFIFDGAKTLKESKSWVKVQRPYVGSVDPVSGEFKDVRDVTVIGFVEKK